MKKRNVITRTFRVLPGFALTLALFAFVQPFARAALPVTGGLAVWLDAAVGVTTNGSGAILTWSDQSGQAHHGTPVGTPPTLGSNQVNAKPAVKFRSGGYLDLAGTFFAKEQYVVLRSPQPTWNGSGSFLGRKVGRGSSFNLRNGDVTFWPDQAPEAVSRNGTPVAVEQLDNSQFVLQPLVNFMLVKVTVNNNNTAAASYCVGMNDNLPRCDWDVAEIIGYDHALSASDENLVGGYLATKYALITAYPDATPQANLLSFGLPGLPVTIDQSAKTIVLTVPGGAAVTNLTPVFTLSSNATSDHVSGNAYNFTSPVHYFVTNAGGTLTSDYLVRVTNGTLPVVSRLVCWYDAGVGVTTNSSGVIQRWNDLSGNAHHGVLVSGTPTLALNQLNAKPAAQFRGGYLSLDQPFFAKEQYIVVRSPGELWNGSGAILGRRTWRNYYLQGGTTKFWQDVWPAGVSKDGIVIPQSPASGLGFNLTTITNYMLLKITVADNTPATHEIGRTAGTSPYFDVAEIIGYDSALSPEDEAKVGSYLAAKYKLTTAYPAPPAQITLGIKFFFDGDPLDTQATITISNTIPGQNYRVQYTDLMPPDWSDLSHDPLAIGTTKMVTDESVSTLPQRFYRVRLLP